MWTWDGGSPRIVTPEEARMQDGSVGLITDRARAELLAQAEAALKLRLQGEDLPQARLLLHFWAASLPTSELAAMPAEELAGAALSLWDFARTRPPGPAAVRVFNPRGRAEGWRSPYAIAEIMNDDMPFLVDTALATLHRLDETVHSVVHPVVPVTRDAAGRITALGSGNHESLMQVAFGPQADPEALARVRLALVAAMADVRTAVSDYTPMSTRLAEVAASLPASTERDFLGWMSQDNFVLLGYRKLCQVGPGLVSPEPTASLGLLRDPARAVFGRQHGTGALLPATLESLRQPDRVAVAKADMRSTVHRAQLCDVVVVKDPPDANGEPTGLHLFLGLFAADAYNRNPRSIPMLREKVERILAEAGVDPEGHDGRALRHILDTWPRDDLFQGTEAEVLAAARRVLDLEVRPRLALFVRRDLFGGHVSAIVCVPRDQFDTRLRRSLADMVARAFGGTVAGYAIAMGDGPLARVQFVIAADPQVSGQVDVAALEAAMAQEARSFADRLADALAAEQGEAEAARTLSVWGDAFPDDYAARHTATASVHDIRLAEAAREAGRLRMALVRPMGAPPHRMALKLFNPAQAVPLSDILPLIETLGLRVIEEVPNRLRPRTGTGVVLQTLTVESADAAAIDVDATGPALLDTLEAVWGQRAEADGFNRLVLRAGLTWREAWLLRAMFKWCRQVGFPFSQAAVQTALAASPQSARTLVDLFHRRFDPSLQRNAAAEARLDAAWSAELDAIASPDDDRILRRLRTLLDAVVRTNFYIPGERDVIALKIDSARAGNMPLPRPLVEIWVHGARMEGCHMRGGRVARGGIRWSDRREDFRTEILGLMKAQMVKNVVIVPVGAKGGFVLKRPPAPTGDAARDREAFAAEGVACYRLLINGMLDVTDNLRADGGTVVPPDHVVRRDGDDPYLVVAADKGTATFSDIANGIAVERGFWLGDAFASGGSIGYDHKAIGITARGAWVNIARHFREMGRDIHTQEFTCVGVGDMSGDVFGNGLLVSHRTKLLAAFDHRHIFLDPSPDALASFAERKRLFHLPRSAWADYDRALISPGGGVYPRSAKAIPLSPEAAAMLGLPPGATEPATVMRAILTAPVDLLYFGGIGTYVKATAESQADAGDRANDAIRVNGAALGARVVGEGANLAVTQAGRIEAAMAGVRLNTDALDNSAGVSTSDHEVNIKILLADATASGRLTERQRVDLLGSMTDEVAELVLRDNQQQSQAISLDALGGALDLPAQNALMGLLEADLVLNRAVAGLPAPGSMAARAAAGQGLTRPELCTLMAHTKLWLAARIDASSLPDDPALGAVLVDYFPHKLRTGFAREIARHRLRKELIGTAITNGLVNRLGAAAFGRLVADAGVDAVEVAKAALIARDAFGLPEAWTAIEALEPTVPSAALLRVLVATRRLQESTARALLAGGPVSAPIAEAVAALKPGLAELVAKAGARSGGSPEAASLMASGVPAQLAALAAALPDLLAAPLVVRLAATRGVGVDEAARAWSGTGEAFAIEALRGAVAAIPAQGPWGARAAAALSDDLSALQSEFAARALEGGIDAAALLARTGAVGVRAVALAREAAAMPDLAAATVATRALRALEP
jgi:glutamate dehydrogenase